MKVAEPLYYVRLDNASTTRRRNEAHLLDGQRTSQLLLEMFVRDGTYDEYREAVDYVFARCYYSVQIIALLFKFDPPGRRQLIEARAHMRQRFPRYWRNSFWPQAPRIERLLARANDLSPTALCLAARLVQRFAPRLLPWWYRR